MSAVISRASTTVVCQHYFTTNCTGLTASSVQACRNRSPCLRNQAPTFLTDYCVSAAAPLVVAPSLLLVLQSGIHCLTVCSIQLLDQSSFDGLWKPTCLPVVIVSFRGVLRIRAIQMYIYLLTNLTPSTKVSNPSPRVKHQSVLQSSNWHVLFHGVARQVNQTAKRYRPDSDSRLSKTIIAAR